jgi:hypothetical protein
MSQNKGEIKMEDIIFGCSVVDKKTVGDYIYYLYSRLDNYAVIMKQKSDQSTYRFKVVLQHETIATVWDEASQQTYVRPHEMNAITKKYVVGKMLAFVGANRNTPSKW